MTRGPTVLIVISGVEVREDTVVFVACRERDFDDVIDVLARLFVLADVRAGRAELAGQRFIVRPVVARARDVDAEVVALHHADACHVDAARGFARVPRRLGRDVDLVFGAVAAVEDDPFLIRVPKLEDGALRERLDHRHVHPDRLGRRWNHDLQPRSEAGARAGDAAQFVGWNEHSAAEKLDLQFDRFQHALIQRVRATIAR